MNRYKIDEINASYIMRVIDGIVNGGESPARSGVIVNDKDEFTPKGGIIIGNRYVLIHEEDKLIITYGEYPYSGGEADCTPENLKSVMKEIFNEEPDPEIMNELMNKLIIRDLKVPVSPERSF